VAPLTPQIAQLTSLPGVEATAARAIRAESGTERSRFGSATRLASWAGGCPGNNESAGKPRRGRRRHGHRSLRRVWGQWAWAARKTPTSLGRTFRRLEARLGGKTAAVAIAHKLLVIVYHLLAEGTFDAAERYDRLQPRQEEHQRKRAVKALEQRGSQVRFAKGAEAAPLVSHTCAMAAGFRAPSKPATAKRGVVRLHDGRYFVGTGQSCVKRGLRLLKAPLFFVAVLGVKKPRRIAGLVMVMTLALWVYAVAQRRRRQP
jgi:hypothetical protein